MPSTMLHRLEGRLFIADGSLCMVVRVDVDAGQAQVSSRTVEGQRILLDMPLTEVSNRLSSTPKLDNVRGPTAMNRVFTTESDTKIEQEAQETQASDTELQWFFNAREGRQGPYATEDQAAHALARYILQTQDSKAQIEATARV